MNQLYELFLSKIGHARINGTVHVLFKTHVIFPLKGPLVSPPDHKEAIPVKTGSL